MNEIRKEKIDKVFTNLFVKLSQAQAKSIEKSSKQLKKQIPKTYTKRSGW